MPWYLYIALRHLFPSGRRLPFFTLMSLAGVALGVALLLVVISVFNGFGHEIRGRIAETFGDLRVEGAGILRDHQSLARRLRDDERVAEVAPYAHGMVMMQRGDRPAFPAVQGIDVQAEQAVLPVDEHLLSGSIDALDDGTALVSSGVANALGLRVGSEVEVYTPLMLDRLKRDEILLPRSLRVAGIFHTGWHAVDESTVLVTLRLMQELYGLGDGVHGLKVKAAEGFEPQALAMALNRELDPPLRVFSWIDSNREFLAILQFEKRMMFFLLFFIVIVSAFSITSSLLISVIRKTREIGLYASLGATSRQIAACFCLQGLAIGLGGAGAGFALGFSLLRFRNQIVNLVASAMGIRDSMAETYGFSFLPARVESADLAAIGILSVVIATLAGLLPAFKASRLKPAEALRSE